MHQATHCTHRYAPITCTWHHIFTVSHITLHYNISTSYIITTSAQHCLHMLYSTAQLKQPWPLIITWYNELSQRIQSFYTIYCTRPSMQVCKRWMTMSIGFIVVPMLITSSWWLVSDILELITPSDHERSFKSVIAILYLGSECAFTRSCIAQVGILYLQEPHPGIKLYPEQWTRPNGVLTTHAHCLKQSHCLLAPSNNLHCVVVGVHSH